MLYNWFEFQYSYDHSATYRGLVGICCIGIPTEHTYDVTIDASSYAIGPQLIMGVHCLPQESPDRYAQPGISRAILATLNPHARRLDPQILSWKLLEQLQTQLCVKRKAVK